MRMLRFTLGELLLVTFATAVALGFIALVRPIGGAWLSIFLLVGIYIAVVKALLQVRRDQREPASEPHLANDGIGSPRNET